MGMQRKCMSMCVRTYYVFEGSGNQAKPTVKIERKIPPQGPLVLSFETVFYPVASSGLDGYDVKRSYFQ